MADQTEWLTVSQVAEHVHVTQETVRRWLRSGELPAVYLGSVRAGYRISRADLDAFMQARYGVRAAGKARAAA